MYFRILRMYCGLISMVFMGILPPQTYIGFSLTKNKVRVVFLTKTEIDISRNLYPH